MKWIYRKIKRWVSLLRFGHVTNKIVGTAGHDVPAEIEIYDRNGRNIGFWGYGSYDPSGPYQGEQD